MNKDLQDRMVANLRKLVGHHEQSISLCNQMLRASTLRRWQAIVALKAAVGGDVVMTKKVGRDIADGVLRPVSYYNDRYDAEHRLARWYKQYLTTQEENQNEDQDK